MTRGENGQAKLLTQSEAEREWYGIALGHICYLEILFFFSLITGSQMKGIFSFNKKLNRVILIPAATSVDRCDLMPPTDYRLIHGYVRASLHPIVKQRRHYSKYL